MNNQPLTKDALDILLSEYANLKDEIKERLKIAFSHVAYAGGIAAFAIPAADKAGKWSSQALGVSIFGFFCLCLVAFLNMRWVQHCGEYTRRIEDRINAHFGMKVLGWEGYANQVQASWWFILPKKPIRGTFLSDWDSSVLTRAVTPPAQ